MTHNWKIKKHKFFLFACKAKISRQINDILDTGPDTENTAWPEIQDMRPQYISAVFVMKSYSYLTNASYNYKNTFCSIFCLTKAEK
jgi:hypothetical protein